MKDPKVMGLAIAVIAVVLGLVGWMASKSPSNSGPVVETPQPDAASVAQQPPPAAGGPQKSGGNAAPPAMDATGAAIIK